MTSTPAATIQPPLRTGAFAWFFNPYIQIGIGSILVTASEVLLRKGALAAPHLPQLPTWIGGVAALASLWTWGGIVLYILSFVSWLYVLRYVPLTIAFCLINTVHLLVPAGASLVLRESVPMLRWIGILIILGGIIMVMGTVAKAEEKL